MFNKGLYTLITVLALFANQANGAPMAYSVNSDGQNELTWDSLYLIDLSVSGSEQRRGPLFSSGYDHFDTEGLAFDLEGTLWGIDDSSRTLFPFSANPTLTGAINYSDVITLTNLPFEEGPEFGGNDFGMTFACDGTLYLTSLINTRLYRVNIEGTTGTVQSIGNLGVNISAIAAIGSPTRLYGLGNGLLESGAVDSPNLYSIDPATGLASFIGPLVNAAGYNEAGLAFDADGNLWAITDRSGLDNQPSQVLMINTDTGEATVVSTTLETGFESLAIVPPSACTDILPGVYEDPYHRIPTLGPTGLLSAILALMLAGAVFLRRHTS